MQENFQVGTVRFDVTDIKPEEITNQGKVSEGTAIFRTPKYGQYGDEDFEYDPGTIIFYNPENQEID